MNAQAIGTLVLAGGAIAVVVWLLNKIGRALTAVLEAVATVAMVLVTLWLLVKTVYVVGKAAVTHWRTTLGGTILAGWVWWCGWVPVTGALLAVVVVLVVWRWRHRLSFETWAGRRLRSWWQRWAVYARKLPGWLRACGLTVMDADRPIVVTANPLGRNKVRRQPKQRADQVPKVLRVRSGASWDEVRVRLCPARNQRTSTTLLAPWRWLVG